MAGRMSRFFVLQPRRIHWWATAVQRVGTLLFNISCGNALRVNLAAQAASTSGDQMPTVPPALVASTLAWFEVCHGGVAWCPRSWAWWITSANLTGSPAFGVSAVAGYINSSTGQLNTADRSSATAFVGAVCLLVGPERTEPVSTEPVSTEPGVRSP